MTSNGNWWPEVEFARPDPPRPSPGHWDLVPERSSVIARFTGRCRRATTLRLADVSGSCEITTPGRSTTCSITVGMPSAEGLNRRQRACLGGRPPGAPFAVYRGRRLGITPGGDLRVDGMLTVGTVTERLGWAVSRHVLSVGADGTERLVFTAETALDRRWFGLAAVPPGSGRTVKLQVRGEFTRAGAA